ncbi:protein of unknown function [endosymbiont DhMRE of Dentiscutata heterogama]|uniref:hypothetical protein n=1 Tax=endosymbiont DhMRE of Dentiscutata heterogama TaxID=1609546 RepID=UPI000629DAFE|nr:hypothetical protein [endosymbiont DhMRE of Dentiscutata heterogama]CFW92987.1 protein of unknown function [endosymbiont DhMRE of Dentiscutata heterogama]
MATIQPNLVITDEDVEVNPELWIQKINVILFNDTSGKNYWNRNYIFIPHHKRYNEAVKWIKDTKFHEYSCRIVKNTDNEIQVVTQNMFGDRRVLDDKEREILVKIRKRIYQEINNTSENSYQKELEKGLKLTTYEEFYYFPYSGLFTEELAELKKIEERKKSNAGKNYFSYDFARPDLAILWRKQLYFVTQHFYTNNYQLYIRFWAKKCLLAMYYWNWMRSAGLGYLERGPVTKDPDNRKHFPFCSDLGNKKIYHNPFKSYQPKLAIFRAHALGKESMSMSEEGIGGGGLNGKMSFPSEVALERFSIIGIKSGILGSFFSSIASFARGPFNALRKLAREIISGEVFLTIGCGEQEDTLPAIGTASVKNTFFKKEMSGEEVLFEQNPKIAEWLKKQPHLWSHVTFHFYFLQEIVLPANALYLGIKEKDGKFVLPWKLFLTSGPGSVNYRFEFAHLGANYKISSSETFYPLFNLFSIIKSFKVEAATFGAGASWKEDTTNEFIKKIGSNNQKKGKFEKKAARDKKAAEKAAESSKLVNNADPDASSSIDYHYSFTDLFHHLTKESLFYRIYISETLYNNLKWANNKEGEVNLPIEWENFGNFSQKVGMWQWRDVYLENDIDNFFTGIMERGYYLTEGEKLTNPDFGYERVANYSKISGNAFDAYFAEEERKEEITEEKVADGQTGNVGYAHTTFLRPTNPSQMDLWLNQLRPISPDPSSEKGWCWGCFSHQINTHGGNGTEMKVDGYFEPTEDTDIEFFMIKNDTTTRQVASCQAGIKYEVILRRTNTTIDVYFKSTTSYTTFKEAKKISSQKLDEKELENMEGENEEFKEEELDLNEVEQENLSGGVGEGLERERENEDEKEQEGEKEGEKEGEGETETEKIEKEKEKEGETEREKAEREKLEKEKAEAEKQEQERQAQEQENEGEEEGEN